jgi:hypothetical protein
MPERTKPTAAEAHQLSIDELEHAAATELPEREEISLINANLALPINAAVAANVLSDNAAAIANATQQTPISQSTV